MWCPSMKWLESKILQSVTPGSKAMAGRTPAIRTLAPSDPWVLSFIHHHRNIQKSYSNYSQYVPWLHYTPTINGIDTEIKVKNKISYSTRKVIMIPVKRSTGSLTAALWKVGETAPIALLDGRHSTQVTFESLWAQPTIHIWVLGLVWLLGKTFLKG